MLNVTIMTGRLVGDPELRQTQGGISVASFRIAVKRDFVKTGDDDTDFFDVVAWCATAEFISKFFKKGSMIQVAGRLQNRHWTDKHDQTRTSTELVVDRAYFGDSKVKDDDDGIDPFEDGENPANSMPPDFDPFG